jgi:hypothetical protein
MLILVFDSQYFSNKFQLIVLSNAIGFSKIKRRKILKFNTIKTPLSTILLIVSFAVYSQELELLAEYPLIDNLVDVTGNNSDVFLEGNPTPPTPPSIGTALCSNGIYITDPDGQNIQTPIMPTFDIRNFIIEVDFNVTELPAANAPRPRMPVIMGSKYARWLGIYIDSTGNLGFKFNNDVSNYRWSNTAITGAGIWYSAEISYNNGLVELFLEDQLILTENVGPLNTFQNTFNFTVTDFSEGNPFNGCIRNLKISTTPDLIFRDYFEAN